MNKLLFFLLTRRAPLMVYGLLTNKITTMEYLRFSFHRYILDKSGLRFKIEVSFKQAIRTVGAFGYHFWMSEMKAPKRRGATHFLHRWNEEYRNKVRRKLDAYHLYIQFGLIAQGSLQYLASCHTEQVWKAFGSWLRTIRDGVLPSELVTSIALRDTIAEFLSNKSGMSNIV